MKLVLFINDKLVDCLPVQAARLADPGYIDELKITLITRNQEALEASPASAQFFIEGVPSGMNRKQ